MVFLLAGLVTALVGLVFGLPSLRIKGFYLALIIVAAGVLSALFVNDVVCLVMAPIVLDLVRRLRQRPSRRG